MTHPLGEPWLSPDRLTCEHATYVVSTNPTLLVCRCVICVRCGRHTGNTTQGHFWGWCRAASALRAHHFCCPDDCELEADRDQP